MRIIRSFILLISLILVSTNAAEKKVIGELTFYGSGDNCPPSDEIAFPGLRKGAGGTSTYSDPITIASSTAWLSAGKKLYIAAYKKYFIMEDTCGECERDWDSHKHYHVDAWLGPSTIHAGTTNCEVALTLSSTEFILNPTPNHPVDVTPFFNASTGKCLKTPGTCVDKGNKCGNTCKIPSSLSCDEAASLFLLTRFKALNPNINCSKKISSGKSVCMSGSCGGP